jgi:hypothetical protein
MFRTNLVRWDVGGSNLYIQTPAVMGLFLFFQLPSKQILGYCFAMQHDCIIQHPLQPFIYNYDL